MSTVAAVVLAAVVGTPGAAGAAPPRTCDLPTTETIAAEPWASQRLGYRSVWSVTRGAGVTVAVVDTGVDGSHPMLAGRVLPGVDVVNGGGRADTDCAGHGTAVAGIIGAQPVAGMGFAGVAPEATILPVRQANTIDGTVSTLAEGIRAAVDAGARVVNVSVVVPASVPALSRAVTYALDHDVVVVAAAGNDAQQGDPGKYPASYDGVIAVGAVDADGNPGTFSESCVNLSVVAPGVDIVVPGAGGPGLVANQNGTSYAAPFVAGVAALVRAYRPELTAAQVKHRIEATADRLVTAQPTTAQPSAGQSIAVLPDPEYGFGMVNPARAVTAELPEESEPDGDGAARPPSSPAPGIADGPATGPSWTWGELAVAGLAGCAILEIAVFGVIGVRRRRVWRHKLGDEPAEG